MSKTLISLSLGETKTGLSLANEDKVNANMTWDEATMTWDEAQFTWDSQKYHLSKESKSKVSLSNE